MSPDLSSREKVVKAAVKLFNTHGYDGTSVREIAKEAGVNVSLISYYFQGKKGLLEYLMSNFLEGFLLEIENVFRQLDKYSAKDSLYRLIDNLLSFQRENYPIARLVHREITIDSILVREIMSTYFMKEKFYLQEIIRQGIKRREFVKVPIPFICMQLRNLIITPFLNPQYLQEVYQLAPHDAYFIRNYRKVVNTWVQNTLLSKSFLHGELAYTSAPLVIGT